MSRRRVARWSVGRTDGTTATLRATRQGDRLVIAERRGRRWEPTHDIAATPDAGRALARQHQRRKDRGRR